MILCFFFCIIFFIFLEKIESNLFNLEYVVVIGGVISSVLFFFFVCFEIVWYKSRLFLVVIEISFDVFVNGCNFILISNFFLCILVMIVDCC